MYYVWQSARYASFASNHAHITNTAQYKTSGWRVSILIWRRSKNITFLPRPSVIIISTHPFALGALPLKTHARARRPRSRCLAALFPPSPLQFETAPTPQPSHCAHTRVRRARHVCHVDSLRAARGTTTSTQGYTDWRDHFGREGDKPSCVEHCFDV